MEHLLFAIYLILFAWLVIKTNFFTHSGLTATQLIIVFLLKVIVGIIYGWMGVYYSLLGQKLDTWFYHYQGIRSYHLLLHNPHNYFIDLFQNNYKEGYGNFLSHKNSWWNDLHSNAFIMILSIFDLFSFGNYFTNLIFFSYLSLFGPIALLRIMQDVFPGRQIVLLLAVFLLPSFIYWTSGIHKDGIVFLSLMLVVYNVYFGIKNHLTFKRIVFIVTGLLIILALRNYLLFVLFPALVAWMLSQKLKAKPILIYTIVYLFSFILFFSAKGIYPKLNFPAIVVEKQKGFIKLKGRSALAVTPLQPTVHSFVTNAPEAFINATLRPFPSDVKDIPSLSAAVETDFLLFCFLLFIVFRRRGHYNNTFLLFCLFFSFSCLLIIGYTVTVMGAIVRYRSIMLPFVIVPMIKLTNWEKISRLITKKH